MDMKKVLTNIHIATAFFSRQDKTLFLWANGEDKTRVIYTLANARFIQIKAV